MTVASLPGQSLFASGLPAGWPDYTAFVLVVIGIAGLIGRRGERDPAPHPQSGMSGPG